MKLGRIIRKNSHVLTQIHNRLSERSTADILITRNKIDKIKIDCTLHDRSFILTDNTYVIVVRSFPCKEKFGVRAYSMPEAFFTQPINSISVGIALVKTFRLGAEFTVSSDQLSRKCYQIPYQPEEFVMIPLLH